MSKLLVAFGTLTYNTETVAQKIFDIAQNSGNFDEVEMRNVLEIFDPAELEQYDYIIIGTSTWGEGDYPPDMEEFVNNLSSSNINLQDKPIAVFGLGETSYEQYCGAAENLKNLLQKNFRARIIKELLKIDGYPDDEILAEIEKWTEGIIQYFTD